MLTYISYRITEMIAILLPYPMAYSFVRMLFTLSYAAGIQSRPIHKNISMVLKKDIDDPEVKKLAKTVYINWGKNVVDFLKHGIISKNRLKQRIKLDGTDNLAKALEKGRGAVIFTCHVGNFEWGACRMAVEGFVVRGVSLVRKSRLTNTFFEAKRLSKGLKTLYINRMIHVFRYLKDNEVVAIPSDWDPTGRSKKLFNFFGRKAYLPTGAVQIALRSGADLIPSFIWRDGKYNHRQVICEPIALDRTGSKEEMLEKNMEKIIPIMEEYISTHISEWELFHDIWEK